MRRIAIALSLLGTMLLCAGSAQASTLTESGGIIYYVAGPGERNDIQVGVDSILGGTVNVYSFKDGDANPITIGGGRCELINGVGMCRQSSINSFVIDARDRDDTITVSTAGTGAVPPLTRGAVMIGGRGDDILKGNDGRDSLRGREGADIYKGGRGRDTLQTLDGRRDTLISCGDGSDDVLRKDKVDPRGRHCEHSNHKNVSKPS
jgi:Ca2+-binding RTX toxin-like protein